MDNRSEQKAENSPLYPAIDPFSQEMLDVGMAIGLFGTIRRAGWVSRGGCSWWTWCRVQRVNAPIFRSDQISDHHV